MGRGIGVVERERKKKVVAMVRAMVISACAPTGGIQADAFRSYMEYEVPRVGRSGFYQWFDEPLERLMERIAQHAVDYAKTQRATSMRIAGAFELADPWERRWDWQEIADYIEHLGSDPNWRRTPSVLDQMRGWVKRPAPKRRGKTRPPAVQET